MLTSSLSLLLSLFSANHKQSQIQTVKEPLPASDGETEESECCLIYLSDWHWFCSVCLRRENDQSSFLKSVFVLNYKYLGLRECAVYLSISMLLCRKQQLCWWTKNTAGRREEVKCQKRSSSSWTSSPYWSETCMLSTLSSYDLWTTTGAAFLLDTHDSSHIIYVTDSKLHVCRYDDLMDLVMGNLAVFYRARWLKESSPEAEELFRMVAEVFIFWAKSHVRNPWQWRCFV